MRYAVILFFVLLSSVVMAQDDIEIEVPQDIQDLPDCEGGMSGLRPGDRLVLDDINLRTDELPSILRSLGDISDTEYQADLQDWVIRAEVQYRRMYGNLPMCRQLQQIDYAFREILDRLFVQSALWNLVVDIEDEGRRVPDRYIDVLIDTSAEVSALMTLLADGFVELSEMG